MELWHAVLDFARRSGVTSEPWGRDRERVKELLAELYLVGDRPSIDEIRTYLTAQGVPDSAWSRAIIRLWRTCLRQPARRVLSGQWAYPFAIPDLLVEQNSLRTIDDRLIDALAAAAVDHLTIAKDEPGSPAAEQARAIFLLTAQATDWRALSHDRADNHGWPSVTSRQRGPDGFVEHYTRTGRERAEARLEESLRQRDAIEAAWRKDQAADQET